MTFVTFGKWPGVLGMGVRVPVALACCCVTNGFVSAGNGGDRWDRNSSTLLFLTKCLKSFGYGILIYFLVVMQL